MRPRHREILKMRFSGRPGLIVLVAGLVFGQSADSPKFEAADVHSSPKRTNSFLRTAPSHNGRYEIKNATMLDLIRIAYGFTDETISGGPNWVELDRFDVTGKVPAGADTDQQKAMLQSLLAERFALAVRKDTKPIATWVLAAGKQPRLKEADGSGETGCKVQGSGAPAEGGIRLFTSSPDGTSTTINLGPGGTIQYACRNTTMAAFAAALRNMMGVQLGSEPVVDQTGLKGTWNFEVRWSLAMLGALRPGEQISVADAVDKQLGLRLEQKPVAKQVLVVESVNRTPTPNPPGLSEALPTPPTPKEFDVADVKLAAPASGFPPGGRIRNQMLPGGRFVCENCPLRLLITQAFNSRANNDQMVGLPAGIDSTRVDITAKVSPEVQVGPGIDPDTLAPMLRSLLAERFNMKYHEEERQVSAYSLVAAKPKMKKADPDSRIFCRRGQAAAGSPPGSQTLVCQNATMALLAEQLLQMNPTLNWPVLDTTGIEGGWDFSLTFSILPMTLLNAAGRGGGGGGPQDSVSAPDPAGGYTIFESIESQLGLKLKAGKRPEKVIVIDHLDSKPTDN
jgi:uncharacterized protein (TIGR03435 family)